MRQRGVGVQPVTDLHRDVVGTGAPEVARVVADNEQAATSTHKEIHGCQGKHQAHDHGRRLGPDATLATVNLAIEAVARRMADHISSGKAREQVQGLDMRELREQLAHLTAARDALMPGPWNLQPGDAILRLDNANVDDVTYGATLRILTKSTSVNGSHAWYSR